MEDLNLEEIHSHSSSEEAQNELKEKIAESERNDLQYRDLLLIREREKQNLLRELKIMQEQIHSHQSEEHQRDNFAIDRSYQRDLEGLEILMNERKLQKQKLQDTNDDYIKEIEKKNPQQVANYLRIKEQYQQLLGETPLWRKYIDSQTFRCDVDLIHIYKLAIQQLTIDLDRKLRYKQALEMESSSFQEGIKQLKRKFQDAQQKEHKILEQLSKQR